MEWSPLSAFCFLFARFHPMGLVSFSLFHVAFSENDDVIERKPSNEGVNSIGSKRAKRKQKAHNGDYSRLQNTQIIEY